MKLSDVIAPCFRELYQKFKAEEYTHYWLKGGRSSGKSAVISVLIVLGLMRDSNAHAIIFRKVGDTIGSSVVSQFEWALNLLGVSSYWRLHKNPYSLTYLPTNQKVYFRGLDDPQKIRSIKLANGFFKFVWFEELTEFGGIDEIEDVLRSIIRGSGHSSVFYSYNPPKSANNWVNAEALQPKANRLVHHSTYLDLPSEWIGEQFIEEAETTKATNEQKYSWAYLGEVTGTGGAIFDNLTIREITNDELRGLTPERFGMDFGYTIDPTALIMCHFKRGQKRLYIIGEFYAVGASIDTMEAAIKQMGAADITSDIDRASGELKSRGVSIRQAVKGRGSVEYGIKWLQDLTEIVIDPRRAPNAAREFSGYEYDRDRYGNFKATYPDANNHTIDAVRYALESEIRGSNTEVLTLYQ